MAKDVTLGSVFANLKEIFVPTVPTMDDLQEDMLAFRAAQNAKRKHADDHLYVTDFAYKPCVRRLAYYFLRPDLQDSKDPKMIFGMDEGTMIHEYFQDWILGPMQNLKGEWECSRCGHIEKGLRPTGPCLGSIKVLDLMDDKWVKTTCKEAKMKWKFKEEHISLEFHGIKVTGRPDGHFIRSGDKLLEIKSMEEEKFNALTEPRDYHVFQASVYGDALGFDEVVILYVNWNHWWQVKAFVVKVNKDALKSIEMTCETVRF